MDEHKVDAESTKESQPIRQNLVNTAVNFLLNPDVILTSDDNKEAFLRKKGLTDDEISLAFEKIKSDVRYNVQKGNLITPPPLPPMPRNHKSSFWSQLRSFSSSVIVLGITFYGIHHFYEVYVAPWLFDKKRPKDHLIQMEAQLLNMNASLSQLQKTVAAMEENINSQRIQMDRYFQNEVNEYLPTPLVLKDLKTELGSVKSLLLSRHQFPAIPKVAVSIPSWQLPTKEENSDIAKAESEDSDQEIIVSLTDVEDNKTTALSQTVLNGMSSSDQSKDVELERALES